VQALLGELRTREPAGVVDLTPGIRSLQIHFDPLRITQHGILDWVLGALANLPSVERMRLPSRIVHLPLSWDDPATQLATQRYQSVRADAPWCPDNIDSSGASMASEPRSGARHRVRCELPVMGLGDVYLGAPVATPLDPRHRLVTTKYNPARTWPPENAVGIGGAYLCVYGMEGPGGYQFVGRTVQMWNRHRQSADFRDGKQWLLRFFDQIRFYPVSAEELLRARRISWPLSCASKRRISIWVIPGSSTRARLDRRIPAPAAPPSTRNATGAPPASMKPRGGKCRKPARPRCRRCMPSPRRSRAVSGRSRSRPASRSKR
jgi:urea carboxylase